MGVYFDGADNGTISNTNASSTQSTLGMAIALGSNANYNTITNSIGTSTSNSGIRLTASSYNSVVDSTGISISNIAITVDSGSDNNTFINTVGNATLSRGFFLSNSDGNMFANGQIRGKDNTYGAFAVYTNSTNNTVANTTIDGMAGTYAITLRTGKNANNTFINNTILNATNLVYLDNNASGNKFILNNFTATSGYYIQDLNGSNYYNGTFASKNQGNIYANVLNGSVEIIGTDASSKSGLYMGTSGSGYPYNSTTSLGKMINATDYAPLTNNQGLQCGLLSTANTVYTMTVNVSINGATCFTVTAQNVTLNCAGYRITGNNASSTYGIYSNQFNTTIKNCNISNFATGIYFDGADNGAIDSTNASTTAVTVGYPYSNGIILYNNANYNTITNSIGIAGSSSNNNGIFIAGGSNNTILNSIGNATGGAAGIRLGSYNTITNFIGTSTTGPGIYITGNSNNITNSTGTSTSSIGIYIYSNSFSNIITNSTCISTSRCLQIERNCSGNTFTNGQIFGSHSTFGALLIYGNSVNNTIANSTINGQTGAYAITIQSGNNTGNMFINNTILNATNLLYIDNNASRNTFILNNFTNTSGYYINDTNGTNYYNGTYAGLNQGNIYWNVLNGSVSIFGSVASSKSGLYIGTSGTGYPYSTANSQGKLSGTIVDYAPLTTQQTPGCAALSTPNLIYNLTDNIQVNGSTCLTVSAANVTIDCKGYSITGNNTPGTYGITTTQRNTTIKNCIVNNFDTGIYFSGASASYGFINNSNATTITSSGNGIYIYNEASNNIVSYSYGNSTYGTGIFLNHLTNNNTVKNSIGISNTSKGIYISDSTNDTIINSQGYSNSSYGIHLDQGFGNFIINSTGTTTTGNGILITSGSSNNTIINSSGNGGLYGNGIYLSGVENNTFINSTGNSTYVNGILLSGSDKNNFTNSAGMSISGYGVRITSGADNNIFMGTTASSNSLSAYYID